MFDTRAVRVSAQYGKRNGRYLRLAAVLQRQLRMTKSRSSSRLIERRISTLGGRFQVAIGGATQMSLFRYLALD
jgi:hypothetical protein